MSAAPIRFVLGGETIECKPLPFGEACLWRDELIGLHFELFPDAVSDAQLTREEAEAIAAEVEAENPDKSANWKAEESARRAGLKSQEKIAKSLASDGVNAMRRSLRAAPRQLDMVCRFARIDPKTRERIEEAMSSDIQAGMNEVNDALAICAGMSNPSKGTEAKIQSEIAAAPLSNGLVKSTS